MRRFALVTSAALATTLFGTVAIAQDGQSVSTGRAVSENPQENSSRLARDAASDATFANQVEKTAQAARKRNDPARPAKAEEVTAGSIVKDATGTQLATIEGVETDGAILSNGTGKVKVPLEAFGLNKGGLLLDITKPQFDELVAQANAPAKS